MTRYISCCLQLSAANRHHLIHSMVVCLVPVQGMLDLDAPILAPMDIESLVEEIRGSAPDRERRRVGADRQQHVLVSD